MIPSISLVAVTTWQHSCFASTFGNSNNFWNFNNVGFWEILNILQFIWGFQFLKDACI